MSRCTNCGYIFTEGKHGCSCTWTLKRVVEGRGADPDVIKNAKTILEIRESMKR